MKFAIFPIFCLAGVALGTDLAPPQRLVKDDLPHAAPTIADVDRDGIRDLVVGLYQDDPYTGARVKLYRNLGTNASPTYAQPVWLQAEQRDASVDEFCYTGFGPQFIDFNGDQLVDLVSGSRDCFLHVFARRRDGSFAAASKVKYFAGEAERQFQYNCRVHLHDWDHDGDHDLLLVRRNLIALLLNHGDSQQPDFGELQPLLTRPSEGVPFSSCSVADWDHDGSSDLIVGFWDASVVWYRNEATADGNPKLSSPVELLGPGDEQVVPVDNDGNFVWPDRPAGHVRIEVTDYNADGLVDLLLGDAWATVQPSSKTAPPKQQSDEQLAQRKEIYAEQQRLRREFEQLRLTPHDETAGSKLVRLAKLDTVRTKGAAAWKACYAESSRRRHGSVWLYLRQRP